jgi:hypothetical protein
MFLGKGNGIYCINITWIILTDNILCYYIYRKFSLKLSNDDDQVSSQVQAGWGKIDWLNNEICTCCSCLEGRGYRISFYNSYRLECKKRNIFPSNTFAVKQIPKNVQGVTKIVDLCTQSTVTYQTSTRTRYLRVRKKDRCSGGEWTNLTKECYH